MKKPLSYQELLDENRVLLEEVHTARRAAELTAQLVVAEISRMEDIRQELEEKNQALLNAQTEINSLRDTLPICARCKSIRNDDGYWQQIEIYFQEHSHSDLSHGICPECEETMYGKTEWYQRLKQKRAKRANDVLKES